MSDIKAPCRFCLQNAREAICLACRTRFEILEEENRNLRKQIDYLKGVAAQKIRHPNQRTSR